MIILGILLREPVKKKCGKLKKKMQKRLKKHVLKMHFKPF